MPQHLKTILDLGNEGTIINMPDGVNPQDAATVAQVEAVATQITGAMFKSVYDIDDNGIVDKAEFANLNGGYF